MRIIKETKQSFNREIQKLAKANIIRKLEKQGIDYQDLKEPEFTNLIADEIEILEMSSKKVGQGFVIGILFTMFTGI